ncbi:hypothetical protein AYO45_04065 [Gammaproteobacteria bacterium SCGC AG-212-F23]|nr:hypothetical protein AYO45_04065 [Gammaproteobacteria bacterium SCGC AG-212-F23]
MRTSLAFLKLIARLPTRVQFRLGTFLGAFLYYLPTQLKYITDVNIKLCFPELDPESKRTLIKKNFRSLGIGLLETAIAWWAPEQNIHFSNKIIGLEHVQAVLKKGKGALLLGPHFTCLEMIARIMIDHLDFAVMYRPHKNPMIAELQQEFRQKKIHYIPRNNMRELVRSLQNNKAIWYAYDIDAGFKRSVFAPFFNIPTASLTTVARVVSLTDTTIIPVRFYRRDDCSGYDIIFSPPLTAFPTEDSLENATRLNQFLEQVIREKPEQYIWQYKRFKTRPLGEKRFY